ncbi:MAG TPA: S1 RNA-binding domain-containing protein, partial [bacterium]|nr:S1 RNA-binding domain-containing protein [bacterium]
RYLIKNNVFISLIVTAVEDGYSPEFPASIGLSLMLALLSNFQSQPFAAIRIVDIEGKYFKNPDFDAIKFSRLDLLVAATENELININSSADDVSIVYLLGAIGYTKTFLDETIKFQKEFIEYLKENFNMENTNKKIEFIYNDDKAIAKFNDKYSAEIIKLVETFENNAIFSLEINSLVKRIINENMADSKNIFQPLQITFLFYELMTKILKEILICQHKRLDIRQFNEFREITCEFGKLPSAHGSGIFRIGHTAVMSVITLCPLNQSYWNLSIEGFQRQTLINNMFFHYFSTGGVSASRLEKFEEYANIVLDKIIQRPLPPLSTLPYVKRIIHEILSTEGSTLSATINAAHLALKDAGVKLKYDFAAAEGAIYFNNSDDFILLADMTGTEKLCADALINLVASEDGIIAFNFKAQKCGVKFETLNKIIDQQHSNVLYIKNKINSVIAKPRESMHPNVQETMIFHLNPNKIYNVVGQNSEYLNQIKHKTNCDIFIENDGFVIIVKRDNFSNLAEAKSLLVARAVAAEATCDSDICKVDASKTEYSEGDIVSARVVKLLPFGIYVETEFGAKGPVYLSELADGNLTKPEEFVKLGDIINVVITEIDGFNYKFSHRKFLEQSNK